MDFSMANIAFIFFKPIFTIYLNVFFKVRAFSVCVYHMFLFYSTLASLRL